MMEKRQRSHHTQTLPAEQGWGLPGEQRGAGIPPGLSQWDSSGHLGNVTPDGH